MINTTLTRSTMLTILVVLGVIAAGCGSDQTTSLTEPGPVPPGATTSVTADTVNDPAEPGESQPYFDDSVPPAVTILVAALTFEEVVVSSPVVMVGEIVSVGDGIVWNSESGAQWEYTEEAAAKGRIPHEFQRLTVRVTEIFKNERGRFLDKGSFAPLTLGQTVTVGVPSMMTGGGPAAMFVGEKIGSVDTLGLRILIVGDQRPITFQDGAIEGMVMAVSPLDVYVELPSVSGAPSRGVRLLAWTGGTLASRGELSEAALAAMQYPDAPEFADLLDRIPGAEKLPREQHLGYEQVTRTTLPQPPEGDTP